LHWGVAYEEEDVVRVLMEACVYPSPSLLNWAAEKGTLESMMGLLIEGSTQLIE
jgi:hypothetical protein